MIEKPITEQLMFELTQGTQAPTTGWKPKISAYSASPFPSTKKQKKHGQNMVHNSAP